MILIGPVVFPDKGSEQARVDARLFLFSQQFPALPAEDKFPLVFSDQSGQFGNQAGCMHYPEFRFCSQLANLDYSPVFLFTIVTLGRFPAEVTRQVAGGGCLQTVIADAFCQQIEQGQNRGLQMVVEAGREGNQMGQIGSDGYIDP